MKLQDFQNMGALVSAAPIKKQIDVKLPEQKPKGEWSNPDVPEFTGKILDETITVYIRRGAAIDAIEVMRADQRDQPFVAIYRSVVDESGNPVFESLEQASRLQLWLAAPLFEAVAEVAGTSPKG